MEQAVLIRSVVVINANQYAFLGKVNPVLSPRRIETRRRRGVKTGIGWTSSRVKESNENPARTGVAIAEADLGISPIDIHQALRLVRRHIDGINSAILGSRPGGAGAGAGDSSTRIGNAGNDADFVIVQIFAAIGVDGIAKHMPIQCGIGVVDFLSDAGAYSVGTQ